MFKPVTPQASSARVPSASSPAAQLSSERKNTERAKAAQPATTSTRHAREQRAAARASSRSQHNTPQHSRKASPTATTAPVSVSEGRFARRRSAFFLLLLILATVSLVLWTTLNTSLDYLEVREVTLPNFVGQPIEVVEKQLQRLGLEVARYEESKNGLPDNYVTSQSPSQGNVVRQGRSIALGVNLPRKAVTLLPLVDLSEAEALDTLEQLHLVAAEIRYVSDAEKPVGTVVATEPESSSLLTPGSSVNLVVSRGSEAAKITMPQMVNLSVNEAERRLRALGVTRIEKVLAGIGNNVVVQHVPSVGETVLAKTPVTLYYRTSNSNVVRVPNLAGKSVQEAFSAISAAGLSVNNNWLQYLNDPAAADGVVTQYPAPGWSVRNAPVALVVNRTANVASNQSYDGTGLPSSPTGVGPVTDSSVVSPYGPSNIPRITTTFSDNNFSTTGLQNPSISRPNIDSNHNNIPLLRPDNAPTNLTATPNTLPSTTSVSDASTYLTPLPPSQLPLPNSTANLNLNNPALSSPLQPVTPVPSQPANPSNATNPATSSLPTTPLPSPPATSQPVVNNGTGRGVPINFSPASYTFLQGRSVRYRLVVADTQGERTVIDEVLSSSESISETITVYGTFGEVSIRTYIDDEYFQGWTP